MKAKEGVRQPAVAGHFYPADSAELETTVRRLLEEANPPAGPVPAALVAPHAGYLYSGPVAGTAYATVAPLVAHVTRVVLVGPSHFVAFQGLALPEASAFASPLGVHPVDEEATDALAGFPQVRRWDVPHQDEHALEVHLPFLQLALGPVPIVPLVTGEAAPSLVADVLEAVWTPGTLVIVSSDLSHYLRYEEACTVDERTARAVEALAVDEIQPSDACGAVALRGLMTSATRRGLAARTLDLRNSGDTAGGRRRVVGYGAFRFAAQEAPV